MQHKEAGEGLMPPLVDTFSDVIEDEIVEEISPSENIYFEFRQAIEPGFFDANFDLTPAKSSANRDSRTGEPFVDQSLRNHLINGAAFGSRFNRALSELGAEATLSSDELKIALALYAVHDAHKTTRAQKRRQELWEETRREDADKDIGDEELYELLEILNLTSFVGIESESHNADVQVNFNEYLAAALATEQSSGRHNSLFSRPFAQKYRDWVRLMDAAGSLSSPTEADSLQNRIDKICDNIQVHYHYLKDTKGITTNLVTKGLSERAKENGVEPLVFFEDGALYLAKEDAPSGAKLLFDEEQQISEEFYTEFLESLVESNPMLGDIEGVRNSLNDTNWPRGYLEITETSFLFAESTEETSAEFSTSVEVVIDAVRSDIEARSERDVNRYSIYETALMRAVEVGLIDSLPPTYQKPQLLGAFIGTLFRNLLYHDSGLCGMGSNGYKTAVEDFADLLGVPDAASLYLNGSANQNSIDELTDELADTLEESPEEVRKQLEDGISPHKQNRVESEFIGIAYLYRDSDYDKRSLAAILQDVQDRFITRYMEWPNHWGGNLSYWDSERPKTELREDFSDRRTGNFSEAFPKYVRRYLSVDGEQFISDVEDLTFDEYIDPKYGSDQPRICLLCREELLGDSTSFNDYETNESEVGRSLTFTHLRELAPSSGEVRSVVCPICQFELNLRNAVHQTNTDSDSLYLFLAPDYFHSPVDLAIANRINSLLNTSVGSFVDLAKQLLTSDVESRSEAAELFIEVLQTDESEDFQRSIQNYDSSYTDANMLGLFRLDRPNRPSTSDEVNRTTFWTLARYIAHVLSWGTGSRVLLSDSPFPSMSFDEFNQMVVTEGLPAPVERHLPGASTISTRSDLDETPTEIAITQTRSTKTTNRIESGESSSNGQQTMGDQSSAPEPGDDEEPLRADTSGQTSLRAFQTAAPEESSTEPEERGESDQETTSEEDTKTTVRGTLKLRTDFGVELYRQSALLYVTKLLHGYDVQRVTTTLDSLTDPFAGANSILRGNETNETYSAQFGARVLDLITHPIMSETLQTLADHGFKVLSPESPSEASTHDYERLFRVACDTLSDGFAERADRKMMIQTVAGEVAKTGSRINQNRQNNYDPSEGHLSDDAIAFAEVFINQIFLDICEGDYYQLRRLQNRLASGFNLTMRESQREFFESLESTDNGEPESASDE